MISESKIKELVEAGLEGTELFVVDIQVNSGSKISILIDGFNGVAINDCVALSKEVEGNLDREVEDFELQVSSAGLDMPFKVKEQYQKNIGRTVKVLTMDGHKHEGLLTSANDEELEIQYEEKVRIEGRKKKELVTQVEKYFFEHEDSNKKIKETKIIISFK